MKKLILIYDDDMDILDICKYILEFSGYLIETRSETDNVVEEVCGIKPDLILMDLKIPSVGGVEALRLLKSNPFTHDLPVLFFSADDSIMKFSSTANADGFIKKPFDINELLHTVSDKLNEVYK